jgi:23S rRNA pseudouridine1911/1915/1917 synthase
MENQTQLSFTITDTDSEQRLDLFLAVHQDLCSRAAVRKLIDSAKVKVNGKIEYRPHYRIKTGDLIVMEMQQLPGGNPELTAEDLPLEIIYEDKDLLVVNKPAGMVIHPATGNMHGTLMNAVLFHVRGMSGVGDNVRSGLIHRIDKDTSGLVLIGKTNKGLWYYSRLFAERLVQKTYIAVSAGNIKPKLQNGKLVVSNYLGRNPVQRKKFSEVRPSKGRPAETEFACLDQVRIEGKEYAVVLAHPKTGRTHQIRVHLSALGLPILGDVIYGKHNKYERLMLHAWKLRVRLLDGGEHEFTAPLPQEFSRFLEIK